MAGYIIHLAVGKVYESNFEVKDLRSFEKGIISPDMTKDKQTSHYGPSSSHPDLNKFAKENGIVDSYSEGYFLHLVTDYLFYNKFLKKWDSSMYNDYDILNKKIIEKYKVEIPKEVEEVVKFVDGELSILNEKDVFNFIDSVGKINLKKIILEKDIEEELLK